MNKLVLAVLVGLVACDDAGAPAVTRDGNYGPFESGCHCSACNPFTQTGCNAGEKCNWIYDQLTPTLAGHIGCEPAGTIAVGGDCGIRALGADVCARGTECVAGECKQICDLQGGMPRCDQEHACVRYDHLFTSGLTTIAGVCDRACDPLTQDLKSGSPRTACGSTVPELPNRGCYGHDEFACLEVAPAVSAVVGLAFTDRVLPAGDALNACAPGFVPILTADTGSVTRLCSGLCAAVEVDNTQPQATVLELGDPTASAKQPTEATSQVGNATCAPGKRGSVTGGPETCRFLWSYNVDSAGMLAITEYTDTLGVCFARDRYKYDSDGDGVLTAADLSTPACATLPPRSTTTPGKYDDAADFFCQKVAHSMFISKSPAKGEKIYVGEAGFEGVGAVSDGASPGARHLFTND